MIISRRQLLAGAACAPLAWAARKNGPFKIGVTDWNLDKTAQVDAVELARKIGFDALEISLGRTSEPGQLKLADAQLQKSYTQALAAQKIILTGTCLDILHVNYLKNDKLAPKLVSESIAITQKLRGRVILLPMFGKGALKTPAEMDYVGDVLREQAPQAEKAGVILALENTISAQDNARILDRIRSKAAQVYYDVGNSTNNGFDILKEIRWLGKDRIAQVHLKDKGYLGEGKIDIPAVLRALQETGFTGFCVLETSAPSGSIENDMRRNLEYVRKLQA